MSEKNFSQYQRPLRVGITGGIGSGKTTVCRLFETLGIPVYNADYWAKWLLENDENLIRGVKAIFGEAAYQEGRYQRALVAREAFGDPEKLARLNALAHPAVEQHSRDWHQRQTHAPYTLKEAALLIESGGHRFLDALILVSAPELLRIARVTARDGSDEAEVRRRIAGQMPEAEKIPFADFIIQNDGQHALIPQVWHIHQQLI